MVLVIIGSFPIVSTLQILPKAIAQTSSETAKATFVNSSSIQSVNVLVDDATSALKNNDVNNAVVHLNLIKQQLVSTALRNVTLLNTSANNTSNRLSTYKNPTYGITSVQYPSDWIVNDTNFQVTNDSAGVR